MAQENKSAGAEWVLQLLEGRVNDTQNPHTRTAIRLVSEWVGVWVLQLSAGRANDTQNPHTHTISAMMFKCQTSNKCCERNVSVVLV